MRASNLSLLLFFCFSSFCFIYGKESGNFVRSLGDLKRASKRSELPYLNAAVIEAGDNVTISLAPNTNVTYIFSLDVGQVAEFTFNVSSMGAGRVSWNPIVVGQSDSGSNQYIDEQTPFTTTVAEHCPLFSADYFATIYSDIPANISFTFNTKTINIPLGQIISANVTPFYHGLIAIPVTSQCKRLLIDFDTEDSYREISVRHNCRIYNEHQCPLAGVTDETFVAGTYESTTQLVVNCTSPGIYYLEYAASNQLSYSVRAQETYPCSEGCLLRGFCEVNTSTCFCYSGNPPNCDYNPGLVAPMTDIYANGTVFDYTPSAVYDDFIPFRLNVTKDGSKLLRLNISVDESVNVSRVLVVISTALPLHEEYIISESVRTGEYIELTLCAGVSTFYFGIRASGELIPPLHISATLESFSVPSDGMFSGTLGGDEYSSQSKMFHFKANATYAIVQVYEETPVMNQIMVTQECIVINDGIVRDEVHAGFYQITVPTKVGEDYYIVVDGYETEYNGQVILTNSLPTCAGCNPDPFYGYCTASGCQCTYGWKGTNCSEVDTGVNVVTVPDNTTTSGTVPSGPYYTTGKLVAVPTAQPAFSFQYFTVVSQDDEIEVFSEINRLPNPVSSYDSAQGMSVFIGSTAVPFQCVPRIPSQAYVLIQSTTEAIANVEITANVVSTRFQVGTNSFIFPGSPEFSTVSFWVELPSNCANVYQITLEKDSNSYIAYTLGGQTTQYCMDTNQFGLEDNGEAYIGVARISNCSLGIDLNIRGRSSSNPMNITIAPIPSSCPNFCSHHGDCEDSVCKCEYPFYGPDCSLYDGECTTLRKDLQNCPSTVPSIFSDVSSQFQYCSLINSDRYVSVFVNDTYQAISNLGVSLTINCYNELVQIICDHQFMKCAPQMGGGTKFLVPCNAFNFSQRCAPGAPGILEEYIDNIKEYYLPEGMICDPNPFTPSPNGTGPYIPPNTKPTSSPATTTGPTSTGPTSTGPSSSGPTSSNPSPTSGQNSGGSVVAPFCALLFVVLLALI